MWYRQFYLAHVLRRVNQLSNPSPSDWSNFEIPREAIFHYPPMYQNDFGINEEHPYTKNWKGINWVYHVTDLYEPSNLVIKKPFQRKSAIIGYHKRYKSFKWLREGKWLYEKGKQVNNNIIIDYALANKGYKYRVNMMTKYYYWRDMYRTIWKTIGKVASKSNRHHFIKLDLPDEVPERLLLNRLQKEFKVAHLKKISDHRSLAIYDLWMWLSGTFRVKSAIHYVDVADLPKINLIISESDKFFVVNMGSLYEWSTGQINDEESVGEDDEENDIVFNKSKGEAVQRKLHMGLTKMREMRLFPHAQKIEEKKEEDKKSALIEEEITLARSGAKGKGKPKTYSSSVSQGEIMDESPVEESQSNETEVTEDEGVDEVIKEEVFEDNETEDVSGGSFEEKLANKMSQKSLQKAIALRDGGFYSQASVEKIKKASEAYKTIPNPFNPKLSIEDVIAQRESRTIEDRKVKTTNIPDNPWIVDKSMLKTKAVNFDKDYIKNNLREDTLAMVMNLQSIGLNVTDYQVVPEKNVLSEYETHRIQFTPVGGGVSTIALKMPKIREDGSFLADGVRYYLRKQRADKVIRKVSPIKSSLTTYYGKVYTVRNQDVKFNIGNFIEKSINAMVMDKTITNLQYGNRTYNDKSHRFFLELARRYKGFTYQGTVFDFHSDEVISLNGEMCRRVATRGSIRFYIDSKGFCHTSQAIPMEYIWDLMGINYNGAPVEHTETKLIGERVPVGFILARYLGLSKMIKQYGLKLKKIHTNEEGRYVAEDRSFAIRFANERWVFDKTDMLTCLLMGGFLKYEKQLKDYPASEFNAKEVYGSIFIDVMGHPRLEKELDTMLDLFIDPISETILQAMGEPTNLPDLLMRATELLIDDSSPNEINMEDMVIKGYERVAGAMYRQLVKAVKMSYTRLAPSAKRKLTIHPNAVWEDIMTDPAKDIQDDINPIQALKEVENVTFEGTGGRSVRTMKEKHRGFDDTDLGVISEATVDNGKVGITTFLSASPNFETVYGTTKITAPKDLRDNRTSLQSTSKVLAPFSDAEDLKRQGFISIQTSHKIPIKGGIVYPVRTGYEHVLAHRLDNRFSYVAKGKGKVVFNESPTVKVQYDDPELGEETISIGDKFANSKGTTYHHHIVCDLPVGTKLNEGDVVVYNRDFFERDLFVPTQVVMKLATIAKVVLMENNDTLEDGSLITTKLSERMSTTAVYQKTIVFKSDSRVENVVKIGDKIDEDSILCTILDGSIGSNVKLDDDVNETLRRLSSNTPKMGEHGTVVKTEVFYRSEVDEMSDTVLEIVRKGDLERRRIARQRGEDPTSGFIASDITIGGKKLLQGYVAITFYVEHANGMAGGDKAVIANQMKTVVSATVGGINRTEKGEDIDAFFGYTSISNRIVDSPILIGMTTSLLKKMTERAIQAYDSGTLID